MRKIIIPILIVFLLVCSVFAQTAQTITLKPGFNFVSFTSSISLTPAQLKAQTPAVEDVYLFSAAAGSFLSANDGTLATLAAGKGYIVKSSATSDTPLSISGDALQTIGNINIKTGFNLIGFSKIPSTTSTFKSLMNIYTSIKGIYKWSPAAGSFIQVVRDNSGAVTLLDGADPSFKAGESYFFNLTEDTTINYDGTDIILGSGPPAPVAKTLEITGTVGASATASPSYSVARAIDLSTMQLSVYDEINNAYVEGAVVTATGANTFKATLPVATADRYLSVLVKNSENKVIYKSFLGRVPKATEVTENTVKISNIKVSDESTARAIIVLENRAKIPVTAVIAKTSVDASIAKTDFALALEEHIAGLEDRVPELKQAVNLIANVLTTAGVDNAIKEKVTEFTFSESSKLLSSYVSLLQDANTLQTVNQITVPTQLTIGSKQITAQSTQVDIYETVAGLNETIGQRVEMPVLTPPPGRYDNPVSITMICATPNANIVYDYGDGNPGITYTAPVSINKTCTLNVASFRSDWPMSWHSKFVNATYTIGAGGGTTETRVLSSITLDRTSEAIVVTTEKYYLSNVKISAHYSNGDSKEVQATRWEMVSSPGSFSDSDNSYYLWSRTGDAIFNAVYSENGIEKKIEFKLLIRTQVELDKLVPTQLTLSKTTDSVQIGGIYDLSKIIVTAHYGDGNTKAVQSTWKIISGGGVVNNNIYIVSETANQIELNCTYSENGYTIQSSLFLNAISSGNIVINPSNITVNPSETTKFIYNNISFTIPAGSVTATGEVSLLDTNISQLYITPGQTIISANVNTPVKRLIIRAPIAQNCSPENLTLFCTTANGEAFICVKPIIEDSTCVFFIENNVVNSPYLHSTNYAENKSVDIVGNTTFNIANEFTPESAKVWQDQSNFWLDITTNKKSVDIKCPYYHQQYSTTCWAAAWLMLLKCHKKILLPAMDSMMKIAYQTSKKYTLAHSVLTTVNGGIEKFNFTLNEMKRDIDRFGVIPATANSGLTMSNPYYCPSAKSLFTLLVEKLSQGKPVMVWSQVHACVVYGYSIDDTKIKEYDYNTPTTTMYINTKFFVHDPAGFPCLEAVKFPDSYITFTYSVIKDINEQPDNFYRILYPNRQINVESYTGEYVAFVIDQLPEKERCQHTINLPADNLPSCSWLGHVALNIGGTQVKTEWTPDVPEGYSWCDNNGNKVNEITALDNIVLKDISVYNTDDKPTTVNFKMLIFNLDNYDHIDQLNNDDSLLSKKFDSVTINKAEQYFFNSIDNLDFIEKLRPKLIELNIQHKLKNNFLLRLAVVREGYLFGDTILDKFDLKFNYNFYSFIIEPEQGSGSLLPYLENVKFTAKVGTETISNDKIIWTIDPANVGATINTGVLFASEEAAEKSFTIKGIVNDVQSIYNGKEAVFILSVLPKLQITINNLRLNYYKIWERERVENISIYDNTDCSWNIIQGSGTLEQVDGHTVTYIASSVDVDTEIIIKATSLINPQKSSLLTLLVRNNIYLKQK